MKNHILIIILIFFSFSDGLFAQLTQKLTSVGGVNSDVTACTDTSGNTYITGTFSGSIIINNQTYNSFGFSDIFTIL